VQVHGVDAEGEFVLRRRLTRTRMLPFFAKLGPCRTGLEACATSHFWARQLRFVGRVTASQIASASAVSFF
jgi:transposase